MTFVRPMRLGVGAAALSLLGLAGFPVLTAAPAAAQYYDDDNGPDDGAYDDRQYDRQYDRGYDDRSYDRGDPGQPWDTSDDGAGDDVDVSFFYDELQDDGRWISHRDFGYVWSPNNVDDDWRPYTRGHWVNTDDYGWYWVSEEPWGWATYHYGRWFLDDRYGWLWVPGSTWGPAWVAWRSSDSYVGWAPLPPDAYWSGRGGLNYDSAAFESPRFAAYWSFVEPRYISTPGIYRYTAPRHRARTIIYSTRPQTRYDYRGDRIVNVGISVNFFDRFLPSPLRSVRVYTTESRFARGFDRQAGNSVRVWRPDLRRQYRADRPRRDRQWAAGSWRNVDRPSRRAAQPAAAPPFEPSMMGRPLQVPGRPPIGLPPSGRTTYTRPPAATAPPAINQPRYDDGDRNRGNWDRSDRGRDDGRNRGDNRGRDDGRSARGTPPPAVAPPAAARPPVAPPTAASPPPGRPDGNSNRNDRGRGDRGRDDGRPGRNAAPPAANAPPAPRPNAAATPPAPPVPPNAGPNAGRNPGAFDPARRPPARAKPANAPPPAAAASPPAATAAPPPAAPPPAVAKPAPAPVDPVANVRRNFLGTQQNGRTPLR